MVGVKDVGQADIASPVGGCDTEQSRPEIRGIGECGILPISEMISFKEIS
jgi:hypothetical protein